MSGGSTKDPPKGPRALLSNSPQSGALGSGRGTVSLGLNLSVSQNGLNGAFNMGVSGSPVTASPTGHGFSISVPTGPRAMAGKTQSHSSVFGLTNGIESILSSSSYYEI